MPEAVAWTEPTGGFLTWLTLPEELDALALRPAALAAGVAYVPGAPFHVGDSGRNTLRLSFSHLGEAELETAVERLAPSFGWHWARRASARPNLHASARLGGRRAAVDDAGTSAGTWPPLGLSA